MIRHLRILRAALRLGQAHYDLEALEREMRALGMECDWGWPCDDEVTPCRVCALRGPVEARLEAARAAYVALRRWHA